MFLTCSALFVQLLNVHIPGLLRQISFLPALSVELGQIWTKHQEIILQSQSDSLQLLLFGGKPRSRRLFSRREESAASLTSQRCLAWFRHEGIAVGVCTSLEQPVFFLGTLQRRNLLSQLSLWSFLAQKEDVISELLQNSTRRVARSVTKYRLSVRVMVEERHFTRGIRPCISKSYSEI